MSLQSHSVALSISYRVPHCWTYTDNRVSPTLAQVIFVGYFGGAGHQPRYLGLGVASIALGTFIMSLAHFAAPPYEPGNGPSLTCDRIGESFACSWWHKCISSTLALKLSSLHNTTQFPCNINKISWQISGEKAWALGNSLWLIRSSDLMFE